MRLLKSQKQFLQILVARYVYWHGKRSTDRFDFVGDFQSVAKKYAQLSDKYDGFVRNWQKQYVGDTIDEFERKEERRRSFHEPEAHLEAERATEFIWTIEVADPEPLAREKLHKPLLQQQFDLATRELQIGSSAAGNNGDQPVELLVYPLSNTHQQRLHDDALRVANHLAHLDALDHVSHYLDGFDVYGEVPKITMGSPSAIADAVMQEHAGKPRKERMRIAREQYTLDRSYGGHTDKRHVDKALDRAFARREQNEA